MPWIPSALSEWDFLTTEVRPQGCVWNFEQQRQRFSRQEVISDMPWCTCEIRGKVAGNVEVDFESCIVLKLSNRLDEDCASIFMYSDWSSRTWWRRLPINVNIVVYSENPTSRALSLAVSIILKIKKYTLSRGVMGEGDRININLLHAKNS